MTAHPNRSRTRNPAANPDPADIYDARMRAELTQSAAAALIYSTLRSWQAWESGERQMHPGLWELFRAKTCHFAY